MDSSDLWIRFVLNVVVGTVAGGITNAVAVWMLFHPYERRWGLHGAIPKNKARLARSIGRMVGERLLTPADIVAELTHSNVRGTLDERLTATMHALLETERGPLRELLPPPVFAEVERAARGMVPTIADRVAAYVDTPDFEERVRRFVVRSRGELGEVPLGEVLTAERRERMTRRAEAWAEELAHAPELERGVREYLERHGGEFLGSEQPLLERVPQPVVAALEAAIDNYLPLAVGKLGEFLQQPRARDRIRDALHDLFARFVDDLRFHERVIARLMVTERTFDKVLASLERDGVEQLAALLEDPAVREEISRTIHDAVITYLRRPIREMSGGAESERAQAMVRYSGDYLLRALRDERTRGFLITKLGEVLGRAEHRTVGELLAPVDDDTLVGWMLEAARSPRLRELAADGVEAAVSAALEKPIGRPGRYLPPEAAPRLAAVLAPATWDWAVAQLPGIVERMNIEEMVERKVLGFSTQRVEEMIRNVTQRELDLIVNLGYVLGAVIGTIMFLLSMAIGQI